MATLALRDAGSQRLEQEAARLAALLEGAREAAPRAEGTEVRCAADRERRDGPGFRFVGLPATRRLPTRWLDDRTCAPRSSVRALVLWARAADRRATRGAAPRATGAWCWPPTAWGPSSSSCRPRCHAPRTPMKRARLVRGFTLIEVLVALAIVAIALAAGIRAAGALIDNAQRLADVIAAQWCADNQLVNLKLARQFPGIGDSEFACEQLGRDFMPADAGPRRRPTRTSAASTPTCQRRRAAAAGDACRPCCRATEPMNTTRAPRTMHTARLHAGRGAGRAAHHGRAGRRWPGRASTASCAPATAQPGAASTARCA